MSDVTATNVRTAVELEHKQDAQLSRLERAANVVAAWAGTVSFIVWHLIIFAIWIGFNTTHYAFDPYPFTFLTMTVSLEAIMLSGILLINQAKVSAKQDRRHKLDLQINLLAEQENTIMLRVLDRIGTKLGVDTSELKDYLLDTRAEDVVDAMEQAEIKVKI